MALRAAGIYRGGLTGANHFVWNRSLSSFLTKIQDFANQGERLIDVETYLSGSERKWAGVFRAGNWTQNFVHGITPANFTAVLNDPANQGLAPFNFEFYTEGGQVRMAAILRSGILVPNSPAALVLDVNTSTLHTSNAQNISLGSRLVDIEPYELDGQRRWAAIWLPGNWDSYLVTDLNFQDFKQQTQNKFDDEGMRLIDLETYVDGGQRKWAGIGKYGTWANYFIAGQTFTNFKNKIEDQFTNHGRRLIKLEIYSV